MENLFHGYYRKNENDIKRIWEDGIIMFDTNVLLNLYRYSESTQNIILELIGRFSNQIYLPHQAALEYNRNRYEVIAEQEKAYIEFLEKISQIKKDMQSTSKPPFLSENINIELNIIFDKVGEEVKDSINKYKEYLRSDPIYNAISELFSNRITENYSPDELKELFKQGEDRYKNKVPPGFEDEKKDGDRKFGDFILWKQIIHKAKELNKDVILITDEKKLDWWWKIKDGRIMGPRQELVEEIKLEAKVDFHMYSSENFLSYGQSFLKEKINQKALKEIQSMKNIDLEEIKRFNSIENSKVERELNIKSEVTFISNRIEVINNQIYTIRNRQEMRFDSSTKPDDIHEYLKNLAILESSLNREKIDLSSRLDMLQNRMVNFINNDEKSKFYNLR